MTAKKSLLIEDDVADARHTFGGIWTLIKLEAIGKYLRAFNLALSKQSFTRIYIDAFAGTGRCDIKHGEGTVPIDGSAKRALDTDPSFHRFFFH
jgi:three-Cys-motif partner protein